MSTVWDISEGHRIEVSAWKTKGKDSFVELTVLNRDGETVDSLEIRASRSTQLSSLGEDILERAANLEGQTIKEIEWMASDIRERIRQARSE